MSAVFGGRGLWVLQLSAVAVWFVWGIAPPSVIPAAPTWVEWYLPASVFGALFTWSVRAMVRGTASRGVFGWLGLSLVGAVLLLELGFLYIVATFPSDF